MKKNIDKTMKKNSDIKDKYRVHSFSASDFYTSEARLELENHYHPLLEISSEIDRKSVSFQLSKNASVHGWLKYREGFSANLVNSLLKEFNIQLGQKVLDPFLGSGTTSLVSKVNGINSIGFDLLPTSKIAISAKQNALQYNLDELGAALVFLTKLKIPKTYKNVVNSIRITEGAYPLENDRTISYLQDWLKNNNFSDATNNLLLLCLINSLEKLSYTNKDGQYLRWDYRSEKVIKSNIRRSEAGRAPIKTTLDKGVIPNALDVIIDEFQIIFEDIKDIQNNNSGLSEATIDFFEGSALDELPKLGSNSINAVITSPPYCNRYDYTRTYALELAFLGLDNDKVKDLRQKLLSATVENKSKLHYLQSKYEFLERSNDYFEILDSITECKALQETINALNARQLNGDLNNKSVIRMVEGYFTELSFVYKELYRVCKPGSFVGIVNDNVRYGGEIISVDYISTEIAESFGFTPIKVISLKQQKGNSSQQMKKFGRAPLRKSITIWQKPI